ncbi:hypothetical protein QFW80_16625 [Luteimonas sp. M1R5S18]|uniref:Uncharacterized protein n=1 Tax=Luteimonas rhizosphaericola TaxID=3042024 RepID=A0ABT6JN84_9GAMM|nr:hypothetical protein [Luteimonas rhizosphaericola]MDH5832144.1 hypothetical protein [Luteimonas rhizosphaericola]
MNVLEVMDADRRGVERAIELTKQWDVVQKWRFHLEWHDLARDAVAKVLQYGNRIEQRRRGALSGDADAEAQDWAEFRAALGRCQLGAPQ